MRNIALLLLICFVTAGVALADSTFVSGGNVSGDWTAPGSPFVVSGLCTVLPHDTLRIGPGVTIFFPRPGRFDIDGVLIVEGTRRDSVVFTTDTISNPDGWGGIRLNNPTGTTQFDYCVIEHGRSFADGDFGAGGGFYAIHGSARFNYCSIRYCKAGSGQGLYARDNSTINMQHCTIRDNGSSSGTGGGIIVRNASTLTMDDCSVTSNQALYGGGVSIDASVSVITNSRINKNTAGIWGGGIYCTAGTMTISHTTMMGNSSIGGGALDGRVDLELAMDHCLIVGNTSTRQSAWGPGGGLALEGGEQWITNCTFVANGGANGGAIYAGTGLHISNCIISGQSNGRGLYFPYGGVDVRYCCFAQNEGGDFGGPLNPPALGALTRTNANGDSCDGFMNLFADPQFNDTLTVGYRLLPDSPCIDAGDPRSPRDPDGSLADIGMYWYDPSSAATPRTPVASEFALQCAYPNPFNPSTTFPFEIARESLVSLKIYDLLGREVAVLINEHLRPGAYAARWNAEGTPSGTYFAVLTSGGVRQTQKILLLK